MGFITGVGGQQPCKSSLSELEGLNAVLVRTGGCEEVAVVVVVVVIVDDVLIALLCSEGMLLGSKRGGEREATEGMLLGSKRGHEVSSKSKFKLNGGGERGATEGMLPGSKKGYEVSSKSEFMVPFLPYFFFNLPTFSLLFLYQ